MPETSNRFYTTASKPIQVRFLRLGFQIMRKTFGRPKCAQWQEWAFSLWSSKRRGCRQCHQDPGVLRDKLGAQHRSGCQHLLQPSQQLHLPVTPQGARPGRVPVPSAVGSSAAGIKPGAYIPNNPVPGGTAATHGPRTGRHRSRAMPTDAASGSLWFLPTDTEGGRERAQGWQLLLHGVKSRLPAPAWAGLHQRASRITFFSSLANPLRSLSISECTMWSHWVSGFRHQPVVSSAEPALTPSTEAWPCKALQQPELGLNSLEGP